VKLRTYGVINPELNPIFSGTNPAYAGIGVNTHHFYNYVEILYDDGDDKVTHPTPLPVGDPIRYRIDLFAAPASLYFNLNPLYMKSQFDECGCAIRINSK
jgi:hypothetical protein